MSSSKTYVFISSDGKIWQKPDLTRDEVVADLKFATLFITMAQGASVSIIEDTLSQVAVDAATKFLTARQFSTPLMVMWWKTHMDWNQNTMPKGERRALVSSEEFASKVRITVRDPSSARTPATGIPQSELRKYAKRAAPARDGIPPEFQALWRQCKIVDGFVTPRMQPLLDRELRFRMGFQIKVNGSVVQYTKDEWQINVEYFEGRRGSKVIISKNGQQVTAASPRAPGSRPKGPSLKDKIRAHPAVQSVDDGGPGDFFVNLKPGYEWSGQRSFGTDNASHAARLLKEVTKIQSSVVTAVSRLTKKLLQDRKPATVVRDKKVSDALAEFEGVYRAYHPVRGIAGELDVALRFRIQDLLSQTRGQSSDAAAAQIRAETEDMEDWLARHKPAAPAPKAGRAPPPPPRNSNSVPAPARQAKAAPPAGFEHTTERPKINIKFERLNVYKVGARNGKVLKDMIASKFKGVSSRGANSKSVNDVLPIALRSAVKHNKTHIVFATYMGWKIYFADDPKGLATFNMQGGLIVEPDGELWFTNLNTDAD